MGSVIEEYKIFLNKHKESIFTTVTVGVGTFAAMIALVLFIAFVVWIGGGEGRC